MQYERIKRKSKKNDGNSIPIAVIIAYYGGEVREGKAASVRCVLHNDSRRSAVLNTYDNLMYCHTCGKGGTAINIVMAKENLEFKDAVKRAGEIAIGSGVSVQHNAGRGNRKVSRRTWNI